jgi:hypothetical protein
MILPRILVPSLIEFLRRVYIERKQPWEAWMEAFTASKRVLTHSPVVLIYQDQFATISHLLVYSMAHSHAWGMEPRCGNVGCSAQIGDVVSKTMRGQTNNTRNHGVVMWICNRCNWKSAWAPRPEWIHAIVGHDLFFWHEYPLDKVKCTYVATQCQ